MLVSDGGIIKKRIKNGKIWLKPEEGQEITIKYQGFLAENNKLIDACDNLKVIIGNNNLIEGL